MRCLPELWLLLNNRIKLNWNTLALEQCARNLFILTFVYRRKFVLLFLKLINMNIHTKANSCQQMATKLGSWWLIATITLAFDWGEICAPSWDDYTQVHFSSWVLDEKISLSYLSIMKLQTYIHSLFFLWFQFFSQFKGTVSLFEKSSLLS